MRKGTYKIQGRLGPSVRVYMLYRRESNQPAEKVGSSRSKVTPKRRPSLPKVGDE